MLGGSDEVKQVIGMKDDKNQDVRNAAATAGTDRRHHMQSLLMRESLVDKDLVAATEGETPD